MDKSDILKRLQEIIREAVDDDDVFITESTVATDVEGWDSLAQILIIGEIQNVFGVKLSSVEVNELSNVGDLVDAIKDKVD